MTDADQEAPQNRWPSVEAFDREVSTPTYSSHTWKPGDFRNPDALPYTPPT